MGSVAPNVIKDFLNALKRGEDVTPYSAFYQTPSSKDLCDFGKLLLEIFASGLEYSPTLHNIYRDGKNVSLTLNHITNHQHFPTRINLELLSHFIADMSPGVE